MSPDRNRRDIALVVDDSADSLRLLTDALDSAGMTVMVALDGASALRIIEQVTPDVILLDAVMPGTDGFETCRRIKKISSVAHVPVIFMTGLTETEDLVRGLEVGGVDYVTKPIVVDEMIARIRVHLANARLAQSARAALDVAGRYLFAVDRQGGLLWSTPQAQRLLDESRDENGSAQFRLSEPQLKWLLQTAQDENLLPRPEMECADPAATVLSRAALTQRTAAATRARRTADHTGGFAQGTRPDQPRKRSTVLDFQGQDQSRHRADPGAEPAHDRQASRADLRQARR